MHCVWRNRRSLASGYHWLAMETAELLSRLKPSSNYNQLAPALREDSKKKLQLGSKSLTYWQW
ncbi:hypothetical protein [Nostoc sp. DedQUE09]|uniref:hypothetical protein n=1 Tax=Nostoc sp. DedQUE09 TaxID=3075394 RepID=UPI002AD3E3F4|nr:hypothetical protein [Nostoc sp. DedQUE09]MDZ7954818.1 hypothetical protein [Nostoc sp. DedQUE09]